MIYNANIHTYTLHIIEIQQKDNKTIADYIIALKTAAKWYPFDNDTVAIPIFVRELWDVHTIAPKIDEKDPQTLTEVIKLVEKCSVTHN